jgi:hypothetical protein
MNCPGGFSFPCGLSFRDCCRKSISPLRDGWNQLQYVPATRSPASNACRDGELVGLQAQLSSLRPTVYPGEVVFTTNIVFPVTKPGSHEML